MSGPFAEVYRATLAARTPDGEPATLIVTTRLGHPMGRVWLTFGATFRATLALSNPEVDELTALLHQAKGASAVSTPDVPDPHPTTPKEAPMGRHVTLPDGTRFDLDKEIELSDGTRTRLGVATREQLADHGALLRQRRADQLIEAALSSRIVEMMRRSGAVITDDLDESAARDDIDWMVLRIAAEISREPAVTDSLMFVPQLNAEQYDRCLRELELAHDDPQRTWKRESR